MKFTSKNIEEILIAVLFIAFVLPLILYHTNFINFGSLIDVYFDFIHADNKFDDRRSFFKYLICVVVAFIGIVTTRVYGLRTKPITHRIQKKTVGINLFDISVILFIAFTGYIRIIYNVGHSQLVSELKYSGILHYFSTTFLYLYFLFNLLRNNSKLYFALGAITISTIEIFLLWRGFALWLFLWYILIFVKRINFKNLIFTSILLILVYSLLSTHRNTRVDTDNSDFNRFSSLALALNRLQGFTRSFAVINSDKKFDITASQSAIKQIDVNIWGLNENTKNSIGGSTIGLYFFVGGYLAIFCCFHLLTLLIIILNYFGNSNYLIKAVFILIFSQLNVIFIEGTGLVYFYTIFLSAVFVCLVHLVTGVIISKKQQFNI